MSINNRTPEETLELLKFISNLKNRFSRGAIPPNTQCVAYGCPMEMEKLYTVKMTSCGQSKVQVVKWLRSNKSPSITLSEASAIAGTSGSVVDKNLPKSVADDLKDALEKIGAVIEIVEE
jgi:ribosomal protein L7/L12